MAKSVVKLVALVAASLLLLSGCGKNNPNLAATVGIVEISAVQVEALADEMAQAYPRAMIGWRLIAAELLVANELGRVAKQATGVVPSPEDRRAQLQSSVLLSSLAADSRFVKLAEGYADYLVLRKSGAAMGAMTANPVWLNPSFGVWVQGEARSAGQTGSLSVSLH